VLALLDYVIGTEVAIARASWIDPGEPTCGGANSLHEWNDAKERTHAEVLEAFDRVIGEPTT